MGDLLATGYDLFGWSESRSPGQTYGSALFTEMNRFRGIMEHVISGRLQLDGPREKPGH